VAISQVVDGADGQYGRLTDMQSPAGTFWDSALDRFVDGAMMIGMVLPLVRLPDAMPRWIIVIFGSLEPIGSNGVRYATSRAENSGIDLGRPTFADKGTRSTVMILCALGVF